MTATVPENQVCDADVLVIGGGPAGLHAAFYAGFRGLSVRLVEARPEVGGQLSALYPDKLVYDVPGAPAIRAAELVERLVRQLDGLDVALHTGELAHTLTQEQDGRWRVTTDRAQYTAGAVVLAAGLGALRPREPALPGDASVPVGRDWPAAYPSGPVLIVGGVPQATRAAVDLAGAGVPVTITHRRAGLRGTPGELAALRQAEATGQVRVLAPATLEDVRDGEARLSQGGETLTVPAAEVLTLNGYLPDLSPVLSWPLDWDGEYVPDGPGGRTVLDGVFVAGDVARSGGDFKLLSGALSGAAVAANHAAHHVRPDLKVRPGHSSEKGGPGPRQTATPG